VFGFCIVQQREGSVGPRAGSEEAPYLAAEYGEICGGGQPPGATGAAG
jgi:hypothetical protein